MIPRFRAIQRILAAVAGVLVMAAMTTSTAQAAVCDRACLHSMITKYLDAMVAHDPSQMPLAAKIRFTEDSHELKLGDGLWKTVTGKGNFRQDYIDLRRQIAASQVDLFEGDTRVAYSLVLHVEKRQIAGIETLVYRIPADTKDKPDQLDNPLPGMDDPVPAGKSMSRAEMVRVALTYAEGLRVGGFVKAHTPFASEAYRVENGNKTAGEGCTNKVCDPLTQPMIMHPDIKSSVVVVDEEAGIVLLWMNFGHTSFYDPGKALVVFESFKIWRGQIHAINAVFRFLPQEAERGWPSVE